MKKFVPLPKDHAFAWDPLTEDLELEPFSGCGRENASTGPLPFLSGSEIDALLSEFPSHKDSPSAPFWHESRSPFEPFSFLSPNLDDDPFFSALGIPFYEPIWSEDLPDNTAQALTINGISEPAPSFGLLNNAPPTMEETVVLPDEGRKRRAESPPQIGHVKRTRRSRDEQLTRWLSPFANNATLGQMAHRVRPPSEFRDFNMAHITTEDICAWVTEKNDIYVSLVKHSETRPLNVAEFVALEMANPTPSSSRIIAAVDRFCGTCENRTHNKRLLSATFGDNKLSILHLAGWLMKDAAFAPSVNKLISLYTKCQPEALFKPAKNGVDTPQAYTYHYPGFPGENTPLCKFYDAVWETKDPGPGSGRTPFTVVY
jgi:hypothetical protein